MKESVLRFISFFMVTWIGSYLIITVVELVYGRFGNKSSVEVFVGFINTAILAYLGRMLVIKLAS